MDPLTRYEHLVARLRESACRITPQRLALVRLLAESDTHPTAQELYEALHPTYPTMSLATVYKTLHTLVALGEVAELHTGGGEVRYDGRVTQPHAHVICIRCGRVRDYPAPEVLEQVAAHAQASGLRITGYRVDFFEVCPVCQSEDAASVLE